MVSNSLRPHELQHSRLPSPLLSPGACSNSYPLNQSCHPTILSSAALFSSCPQSFPASGSLPMSRLSHQVTKVMELQFQHQSFQQIFRVHLQHQSFQWIFRVFFRVDWFNPLAVQGTLKGLLQHYNLKASILQGTDFFMVQFSHPYMTIEKTIALTIRTFVSKVISLLFNMLSSFVIAVLSRSKHLLTHWLQSLSAVTLELEKIKSVTASTFLPCLCHGVMGPDVMILVFGMLSFKPAFSLFSFTFIQKAL